MLHRHSFIHLTDNTVFKLVHVPCQAISEHFYRDMHRRAERESSLHEYEVDRF